MNTQLHRLVFNKARGMCVAVAETAAASGKSASGEARGAVAARGVGAALLVCTLTALAAAVQAQTLPTGGTISKGAGSVAVDGAKMIINQMTPRMVADWQSFSIGAGNTVQFVQPSSSAVALNRVLGNDASSIFGSLLSNGHVYLQNPNGVLFAPGAQVSVGSLVATTLNADLREFMDGRLRLSGGSTASGSVRNEGTILTMQGGSVVLAAPQVSNSGSITTPGGTTAMAAANAVNVDPTGSGVLSISVPLAAVNAHLENSGTLQADGGLVSLQAAVQNAATAAARQSVMQVGGVVRARSIEQRDGQIVLSGSGGAAVAVGGTLDASGGDGQRGGSVKVLGDEVTLAGTARVDASGGAGGGTVLVGGNYQGRGPEANAANTTVAAGAVLDASARRSGDGGTVVVWSDKTTNYAGTANARGGDERGNGGLVEVSGKQQLNFRGAADLRAAKGATGTLLLDPTNLTIGTVADVNGDGTPGDDVGPGGVALGGPGNNSQVTAAQVATLLATANLSLAASNSITVAAPVTVAAGGAATTLDLSAGFTVAVNAAMNLRNSSLSAATTAGSSDSIQVNAPIRSDNTIALTSSSIELASSLVAPSVSLTGSPVGGAFNELLELSGGSIGANLLTIRRMTSVNLTQPNNLVGTLDGQANSATIDINNPVGTPLDVRGNFGNLTLTSNSGIEQSTGSSAQALTVGAGSFTLYTDDPGGSTGQVNLTNPSNAFTGNVRFAVGAGIHLVSGGSLRVTDVPDGEGTASSNAGGNIVLEALGGPFRLATSLTSFSTSGGTNIDISGVGFVGERIPGGPGYQLITPSTGRFLVRSSSFLDDNISTFSFSASGARDFNFLAYADYSGADPATGNGFFTDVRGALVARSQDMPAVSRVYDGTRDFSFTQAGTGAQVLEDVDGFLLRGTTGAYSVNATGTFVDKNVGTNKGYTTNASSDVSAVASLTGPDAGARYYGLIDYGFTRAAGPSTQYPTSQVTALAATISGLVANNKVYDATAAATLSGTAVANTLPGDVVTLSGTPGASFNNKNVGNNKPVTVSGYALLGTDAANYTLSQPTGLTANITPANLVIGGISASNKVYDATTVATLTGTPSVTPLSTDVVTIGGSGVGAFNDKNVGTAKPVTVSGFTFGGTDGANYTAVQPTGLTADITARSLAITGLAAANKVYDATTAATLTGTAAIAPLGSDAVTLVGSGVGSFNDKNVGTNKPVSVSGYSFGGGDAGNYTLQSPTLRANITVAPLVVTGVVAANKVYDTTTAATLSGTPTIAPFSGDAVALGGSPVGNFADKNVGIAKPVNVSGFTLSGADAINYALIRPSGVTADITPASLALNGLSAANKTYDATTLATLGGTPSITPLSGDVVTLAGSGVGNFADKNVGTAKPVTVTGYTLAGADGGNYNLVPPGTLTADITPLALAVGGVTAANKVYDATTAASLVGTATVATLSGDAVSLAGTPVATFANKNVGSAKPVTVTGYTLTGLDATNYTLQQPSGLTADITAAPLVITGITAANKVYDTTTVATLLGTPVVSALAGDSVAVRGTGVGRFADKNVGNAKPVTVSGYTLAGADGGNYAVQQPSGLTADITPATLVVSGLTALNKIYDATTLATLAGTPVFTPLSGDAVTLVGGATGRFADKNVGNAKPVTIAGLALGGSDARNYTPVLASPLAADITPRALTVGGVSAANKVYDTTTVATLVGSGSVSGLSGDNLVLGGTPVASFADKNVGTAKPVTVTGYTLSGLDGGNYTLRQPSGLTADITVARLAITGIGAADKVYDGTTAATLTGTAVVAALGRDNVGVAGPGQGVFSDRNVGTNKPVAVSGFTLVGPDAANYLAVQPSGVTASITPADLPINGLQIGGIGAANKVYDGTTAATLTGTPTVTPIRGDQVTVGGTGVGNFANKNVGTAKPVTVTGFTLTGLDAGNYSAVQPTGITADITPAPLALTGLVALSKTYDATRVATLSGLASISALAGDSVTLVGAGVGSFADKNVGTAKPVTVGGYTLGGSDAGNYALVLPSTLTASITPAPLALSGVGAANKVYDATTAATLVGTAVATPLAGDAVTVGGSGVGTFNNKNVGTAKPVAVSGFTLAGADAGNYVLSQPSGLVADITPATLAVGGLAAANKVYDATAAATLIGTPVINALSGDAVVLGGSGVGTFNNKNVGTAKPVSVGGFTLSGADAGNYALALPSGLAANITPATLAVGGVGAAPKVYDTTTGVTLTGTPAVTPLGGDNVVVVGSGTGVLPDKNAGNGKPVTVSGFALGGADAANYTIVQPSGLTADVAPKTLTPVGITAIDRAVDGTTTVALNTSNASVSGVLPGDTVALNASGAVGSVASPTAGSGKQVLVRGLALVGPDAVNYALVPTVDPNGNSGVVIGTVTLLSDAQDLFNRLRDREYLQAISDAQEPFRRAMAEALAAGFGKENIRKQLQRGLVFETGLAPPAVDSIDRAQQPASCVLGGGGTGLRLACN